MKELARVIGVFFYNALISILFMLLSWELIMPWLLARSGFIARCFAAIVIIVTFTWLSEYGVAAVIKPLVKMLNKKIHTIIFANIPVVIIGLWCLTVPFRMQCDFSAWDWVLIVIWMICAFLFFLNLFFVPFMD